MCIYTYVSSKSIFKHSLNELKNKNLKMEAIDGALVAGRPDWENFRPFGDGLI
jgi:hypothetical protein